MRIFVFQIEDIRNSIDKIDENVSEVKKLYSVILSAPTSDQSKMSSGFHIPSHHSYKNVLPLFLLGTQYQRCSRVVLGWRLPALGCFRWCSLRF